MKQTLHNTQVLRLLAASMVLFGHVQHEAQEAPFLAGSGFQPFTPVFWPGGVDIFFVISGFIMVHLASSTLGQPVSAREFWVRRLIRVVPLYWLFTSLMLVSLSLFASHVTHQRTDVVHVLMSYLFIPWENPYGRFYPVLILGWTLNFEMFFYTVMALSLNLPRSWRIGFLVLVVGVLGVLGACLVPVPKPLAFWANPIIFEFLMGAALAMARDRQWWLPRWLGWTLAVAALGVMGWVQHAGIAAHEWLSRPLWMGVPAMMIAAVAVLTPEHGQPGWLKAWLSKGGDLSYALYLSHPFSLTVVAMAWGRLGWGMPWGYVAVAVVVSLLGAWVVHEVVERPMTDWLRQRWEQRRAPRLATLGRADAQ